jgi:hypothetical protein
MPQRNPQKAERVMMRRAEPPMIELEPEEESGPSAEFRYVTRPGGSA